jgi:hypothetical protein
LNRQSLRNTTSGCDSRCKCPCHGLQAFLHSRQLSKAVQSFIFGPSHLSAATCQYKHAVRRKKKDHGSISIFFRSDCFKKAILISLLSRGISLRVYFKCHNLVPETAESIRCAQSGDFQTLEKLIKNKKATVNDTGPDGWSLLHVCDARGYLIVPVDEHRLQHFMNILKSLNSY